MKKGLRGTQLVKKNETKKHIKAFYKGLAQMEEIANKLDSSIEYREDNINDYVIPILGRELDSTEKFLILSKLNKSKEVINNIEVKHGEQESEDKPA